MNELRTQAEILAKCLYTTVTFRDKTTDGDYIYVALNPELEGCLAQGDTIAEAQENLREFRIDYIEHLLETEMPIPEPAWIVAEHHMPIVVNQMTLAGENISDDDKPIFGEMFVQ